MWINLLILVCIQWQCCLSDQYDYQRSNYPYATHGSRVQSGGTLTGDVTIGPGTVVHPGARILAEAGPIMIGGGNVIHANAVIANRSPSSRGYWGGRSVQRIGDGNVFGAGSTIEASKVGNGNMILAGAYVPAGTEIASGCIIGPGSTIEPRCLTRSNYY